MAVEVSAGADAVSDAVSDGAAVVGTTVVGGATGEELGGAAGELGGAAGEVAGGAAATVLPASIAACCATQVVAAIGHPTPAPLRF